MASASCVAQDSIPAVPPLFEPPPGTSIDTVPPEPGTPPLPAGAVLPPVPALAFPLPPFPCGKPLEGSAAEHATATSVAPRPSDDHDRLANFELMTGSSRYEPANVGRARSDQ